MDAPEAILAALPASVFVLDEMGTITYATPRAAASVGRTVEEMLGESVLSFVSEETAWAYAAAVAMASDYANVITGPLRVSFIDADGVERNADLWAENRLDDPDIAGIVCLLTPETVAVWLGEAVEAVARGSGLDTVADHVVTAMRGYPVVTDAVILVPGPDGIEPLGPSTVPGALQVAGGATPWSEAMQTGIRQIHKDLDALPGELVEAAEAAGYAAVWAEPITVDDGPARAVLVCWSRDAGGPSPNQLSLIYQAAGIVGLAWDRTG